jgi:mRNA-degrading endonuclease RelE of RelBE toxin-antitoxin system
MRFTVTLDSDVAKDLRKLMAKDKLKFKEALNQPLQRGLSALEASENRHTRTKGGKEK